MFPSKDSYRIEIELEANSHNIGFELLLNNGCMMWQNLTQEQKENFVSLLKQGYEFWSRFL